MRVKIEFPHKNPLWELQIPVRITDINYGNHLGNDAVLAILHEARMQALASRGYTELNVDGHGLIMADVMVAYKGEAFYGDLLDISIYSDEITARTFDLLYQVSTVRDGMKKEIVHAKTGMVCIDYSTHKVVACGEKLKKWLEGI